LEICQQRAITDTELMALQKDNQRLAEALNLSEAKMRGRDERLAQLQGAKAGAMRELRETEDRRTASEVGL
jgi:hypothetical protein